MFVAIYKKVCLDSTTPDFTGNLHFMLNRDNYQSVMTYALVENAKEFEIVSFRRVLNFFVANILICFNFLSCIYATKNTYSKGFFLFLSGKPGIKCLSFAFFRNFMRVFFS